MKKIFQFTILCLLFVACGEKSDNNIEEETTEAVIEESIKGLWRLHKMEIRDSLDNWTEWRDGMKGYLLYDGNGHMALHLIPKNYENTDLNFPNFTDTISLEALKYITNNYNYFGTYEVDYDSSIVSHFKISHSNPSEWYTTAKRRFSFNGDTLIVQPVEQKNAKLRLKLLKED